MPVAGNASAQVEAAVSFPIFTVKLVLGDGAHKVQQGVVVKRSLSDAACKRFKHRVVPVQGMRRQWVVSVVQHVPGRSVG